MQHLWWTNVIIHLDLEKIGGQMKNLIGGKFVDASNGETAKVINPATNELIDTVPLATEEDVDLCVKEAAKAQKGWAKMPLHERGDILYKFADLVEANHEELAQLLSKRNRKTNKRSKS